MTSTDRSAARPVIRSASQPHAFPATAKPLLASESLIRPVSGLLLTTANLADVVSGLPTRGLNAKTIDASGDSGSASAAPASSNSRVPRPLPPRYSRTRASDSGTRSAWPRLASIRRTQPWYPNGTRALSRFLWRALLVLSSWCLVPGPGRDQGRRTKNQGPDYPPASAERI